MLFTYNDALRIVRIDSGSVKDTFYYDARNRRVKEARGSTGTKFINNAAGQILSEFTLNGYRLGDYVYLNGVLLAKLRYFLNPACADTGGPPPTGPETGGPGDGGICDSILVAYYYHTDHLGTPWYMTSSNKSIVWRGEYYPFGELYSETVSQPNLHRFPGQYKEQNTLYYNWNRWYDPKIGRYLQADPLGLHGSSTNLYGYAISNPLDFFDISGLTHVRLFLQREPEKEGTTLGAFRLSNTLDKEELSGYSLELPDRNNQPFISRIPEGSYEANFYKTDSFPIPHFILKDVPGRTNIVTHWGSNINSTEGCILLGPELGRKNNLPALLNSRASIQAIADYVERIQDIDKKAGETTTYEVMVRNHVTPKIIKSRLRIGPEE